MSKKTRLKHLYEKSQEYSDKTIGNLQDKIVKIQNKIYSSKTEKERINQERKLDDSFWKNKVVLFV